jgi:hypothetical protein
MNKTASAPAAGLERRPHKATRAVVEVFGGEAPRALYHAFDRFNADYFGGELGAPLLFVMQTSSPRAFGDYCGRDVHGLRSRVRIAPAVLARGERFAMDVLLHEMVHAWQSEVDGDTEDGYRGHGPRFAARCNEIGGTLGLAPVGVKGRRGLPDCARWPLCVRPAGYYPEAPKVPARTRRQRKAAGDGATAGDVSTGPNELRDALIDAIAIVEEIDETQREQMGVEAWLTSARALVA